MSLSNTEFENIRVSLEQRLNPRIAEAFACALSDMLGQAIKMFGPRDPSFTVSAVEFGNNYPQVSYPWLPERGVRIRLSEGAHRRATRYDCRYAYWQLAHECIHLLSPTPGRRVSVLEEGIACYFQSEYMRNQYSYVNAKQSIYSFIRAEALMRSLIACDEAAVSRLRQAEPVISQITATLIAEKCPAIAHGVAEALAERFQRGA